MTGGAVIVSEVVAVGTELLLGGVVDTNSAYIGERLAQAGIDNYFQTRVGDNQSRIVAALQAALARADVVIVCGGLGPTPDDITREAIAEVLGVGLEQDPAMVKRIEALFATRGRAMTANNVRQAERPVGTQFIDQTRGTAPGLICVAGSGHGGWAEPAKVIYAVPGVPSEMADMIDRVVIPDLRRRSGLSPGTIVSRTLRTWGVAESTLAEMVADRVDAQTNPSIAFLASGRHGINLRITARAASRSAALGLIEPEERALRAILGDLVFGVDDESMADAVGALLVDRGLTVAVAESLTGGLVGAVLTDSPGAGRWFRGAVVAYDPAVKFDVLDVPEGPVVTAAAAEAMARGVVRVMGADIGLAVTGVAGPSAQVGEPPAPGTVFMATLMGDVAEVVCRQFPGDRLQVRDLAVISLLDLLRRRLLVGTGVGEV